MFVQCLTEAVSVTLTFNFLLEAWTDNKPNNQSGGDGTAQRNAQSAPPGHPVKAKHYGQRKRDMSEKVASGKKNNTNRTLCPFIFCLHALKLKSN